MKNTTLFYNSPASDWIDTLHIGNGRLGAAVYGGVSREQLQLNEESLWSGYFDKIADNPDCKKQLARMRELIFAGKTAECEAVAEKYLVCGAYGTKYHPDRPWAYGTYQTAGELFVDFVGCEEFEDYKRELDISSGEVTVSYSSAGKRFTRKVLASIPDSVIAMSTKADAPFDAKISYEREDVVFEDLDDGLLVRGQFESILWALATKIETDGEIKVVDRVTEVVGARYINVYVSIATDYLGEVANPAHAVIDAINAAVSKGFAAVECDACEKLGSLISRSEIDLGAAEWCAPINEKIVALREGSATEDQIHSVMEFLWQYGRYLNVSSSYKSALPANLQGVWAPEYHPLWSADYHININIQMNYWLTELTNLPECSEVFLKFIKFFAENGKNTAREQYGCRGWVAHTFSTPWAFTSPGNRYQTGSFMCGGAWCCGHIWERWLFSRDVEFLREYYPVLRGASEFFLDFLVTDPNTGYLVTAPSHSPENAYYDPVTRKETVLCVGPTADNAIIYELFTNTAEAAKILGVDGDFAKEIIAAREKLSPYKVGKYGQLLEWQEEFDEVEIGHRHLSHLYGVHPGAQITKTKMPEVLEAAKASVKRRVDNGGGACGFSRVWLVSMSSRLGMTEDAYNHLRLYLKEQIYGSALNCDNAWWHPVPFFQIDGNFGFTAGISEMLLQSHDGFIEVLPTLPSEWKNGSFKGLCARGGFTVDAQWNDGKVTKVTVHNNSGEACELRFGGRSYTLNTKKGESTEIFA